MTKANITDQEKFNKNMKEIEDFKNLLVKLDNDSDEELADYFMSFDSYKCELLEDLYRGTGIISVKINGESIFRYQFVEYDVYRICGSDRVNIPELFENNYDEISRILTIYFLSDTKDQLQTAIKRYIRIREEEIGLLDINLDDFDKDSVVQKVKGYKEKYEEMLKNHKLYNEYIKNIVEEPEEAYSILADIRDDIKEDEKELLKRNESADVAFKHVFDTKFDEIEDIIWDAK